MSLHPYARTDRDLRWLAENFSTGNITNGIPERLECLATWHRLGLEADKAANGETNDFAGANAAYAAAIKRMHAAGVGPSEGVFTFSPCCGPDEVNL